MTAPRWHAFRLTVHSADEAGDVATRIADALDAAGINANPLELMTSAPAPVDPELFARTAPAWNCITNPGRGPHYLPGDACLWCGKSRAEIEAEYS